VQKRGWETIVWKWKGKEIEEVKRYKYLGYVVMANGGQNEHIEERVKKGAVVMRDVGNRKKEVRKRLG